MSQLGSNPFSTRYVIKRPLESKFDVPELIQDQSRDSIHDEDNPNIFMRHHGGITYVDDQGNLGNEVYLCGIIDILQKYNKCKKIEHFIKGITQDKNVGFFKGQNHLISQYILFFIFFKKKKKKKFGFHTVCLFVFFFLSFLLFLVVIFFFLPFSKVAHYLYFAFFLFKVKENLFVLIVKCQCFDHILCNVVRIDYLK
ncbi:hypothetical protein RFI_16493 [Reticulomyxa filosa]|uniref:PIPK domain-containing protein n=1 Tax=Reticulomyxa filosa TaxID=46433 RepID=X6N3T6_RETFI|nr:hypothetical protein RFI_16493 [Reticulomyxa filosa]|eukprot:ETO20726.1 hypothetical protein RFI_16493 [Reticulomyxa filosa]